MKEWTMNKSEMSYIWEKYVTLKIKYFFSILFKTLGLVHFYMLTEAVLIAQKTILWNIITI